VNAAAPRPTALDIELLKRAFLGWLRGERDHCKMAAIPTIKDEMPSDRIASARLSSESKLGIRGFNPKLTKVAN
jgi:transposase